MRRDTLMLAAGATLGALLVVLAPYVLEQFVWKEHHVASITSHYPHEGSNSETTLLIYIKGNSGHVKEILCLFPPSLALEGSNPTFADGVLYPEKKAHWSGLSVVEVGPVGQHYAMGQVGYLCNKKT